MHCGLFCWLFFFCEAVTDFFLKLIFMLVLNVPFGIITLFLLANFLSTSLKSRNRRFFFPRDAIESLQGNGLNSLALK